MTLQCYSFFMKNTNLIIYHGSDHVVDTPKYGVGKPYNDYGLGFYCTESIELAKEWAVGFNRDGFANKYTLDITDLKMLDLSKTGTVLHWITVLLKNRTFDLKNEVAREGKNYLIEHFSLPTTNYDVIKGYRADDSYFSYAEAFLNNTISVRRLKEALRLGDLGEQIVLVSEKAFSKIAFLGYEEAKANIYYPLRAIRNEIARKKFLDNKTGGFRKDDIFLQDIMRGIDEDDPRL